MKSMQTGIGREENYEVDLRPGEKNDFPAA